MDERQAKILIDNYDAIKAAAQQDLENGVFDENQYNDTISRIDKGRRYAEYLLGPGKEQSTGPIPNDTSNLTEGGSFSLSKALFGGAAKQANATLGAAITDTPIVRQVLVDVPNAIGAKVANVPGLNQVFPRPGQGMDQVVADAPSPELAHIGGAALSALATGGAGAVRPVTSLAKIATRTPLVSRATRAAGEVVGGVGKGLSKPVVALAEGASNLAGRIPMIGRSAAVRGAAAGGALGTVNAAGRQAAAGTANAIPGGEQLPESTPLDMAKEVGLSALAGGTFGAAGDIHSAATNKKSYGGSIARLATEAEAGGTYKNEPILAEAPKGDLGRKHVEDMSQKTIVEPTKQAAKRVIEQKMIRRRHEEGVANKKFQEEVQGIGSKVKENAEMDVGDTAVKAEESVRGELGGRLADVRKNVKATIDAIERERGALPVDQKPTLAALDEVRAQFASQSADTGVKQKFGSLVDASGKPIPVGEESVPVYEEMGRAVDRVVKDIGNYASRTGKLTFRDLRNLHASAVKNAQYDSQVTTPQNFAYRQIEKVLRSALRNFDPRIGASLDEFKAVAGSNEKANSILYGKEEKQIGDYEAVVDGEDAIPSAKENEKVAGARRLRSVGDTGPEAALRREQDKALMVELGLADKVEPVIGAKTKAKADVDQAESIVNKVIADEDLASKLRLKNEEYALDETAKTTGFEDEGVIATGEAERQAQGLIDRKVAQEKSRYSLGIPSLANVAISSAHGRVSPYTKHAILNLGQKLSIPMRTTTARHTPDAESLKSSLVGQQKLAMPMLSMSMENVLDAKDKAAIEALLKIPDAVMDPKKKQAKIQEIQAKMASRKAAFDAKGR